MSPPVFQATNFTARLRAACDIATGALLVSSHAASLGGIFMAVIEGMSTLARGGAARASLLPVRKPRCGFVLVQASDAIDFENSTFGECLVSD